MCFTNVRLVVWLVVNKDRKMNVLIRILWVLDVSNVAQLVKWKYLNHNKEDEMKMKQVIEEFFCYFNNNNYVEVYNEFSFQHELGIFLREKLPDYKIQFERNVSFFNIVNTIKKEIDIVIFNADMSEKFAIELKFPLNGQYPEQMYSFIKDAKFMEQLKESGFNQTFCITMVEDKNFYSGINNNGIYRIFRHENIIKGIVSKPTGKTKDEEKIAIHGNYPFSWKKLGNHLTYYILSIE